MVFQFKNLSSFAAINHFITTREGGSSAGNYSGLNLSLHVNDNPNTVEINRNYVAQQLAVETKLLFFPEQCHTANVKCLGKPVLAGDLKVTDALITDVPGIGIGVLAADCVPVLFFDPRNKVIAAAHAGWKGTVKLIVKEVIGTMVNRYGSDPSLILAGIGPAISQTNYEVDSSVIEQVENVVDKSGCFYNFSKNKGHYLLNLQALNYKLLVDAGLQEHNIEVLPLCTYANPDLFFSARRDGFFTGRFGSVICIKSE
jgi:polyphenol oxidase